MEYTIFLNHKDISSI
ncbi:hypothetical protein [Bacillus cytotoxicus]